MVLSSVSNSSIYIAWIAFQRRAQAFQPDFGYQLLHVPSPMRARWLKPLGYIAQMAVTWRALEAMRPKAVWIQLPPNFLPHLVLFHRWLRRCDYQIILDCHNSALRAPWTHWPFFARVLTRADRVVVHNEEVVADVLALGLSGETVSVLEDRPVHFDLVADPTPSRDVLVPCSFGIDEPVSALLEAARLAPDLTFHVTGRRNRARALGYLDGAPQNVVFTDYLTREEFDQLLANCAVVVGLTNKEGIQLSVASEAVGAGRPLVLSDTRILRKLFPGALFSLNSPSAIAAACREAITERTTLMAAMVELRKWRQERWLAQAADLDKLLTETNRANARGPDNGEQRII